LRQKKKGFLADFSMPPNENSVMKEFDTMLKHKYLLNKEVKVIPVITSATGSMLRSFQKKTSPGKHGTADDGHAGNSTHLMQCIDVDSGNYFNCKYVSREAVTDQT
jgi:hypothetical protein